VRRALQVLAAIAALGLAVLYGFFAHSHHWFPYGALHAVHRAFGLGVQNARRWDRPPEGASKLSQREAVNTLLSVPYLRGYDPATGKEGVTVDDAGQAYPGWNICVSAHAPEARLIDMEGTLRHRWSLDVSKVWPARKEDPDFRDYDKFWRRVLLLPDGGLLVIWEYIGIMRIDRDSRLLWANACGAHHDVAVDGAGRIFVLTRQKKILPDVNPDVPVFEDFVTELAPDGRLVKSISLLRAFERSDYAAELAAMKNAGDLFHSNALQILDGSLASRLPAFRKGNILVSISALGIAAVLDPDSGTIVWALSGQWRAQHTPRLLSDGRLLLFDNFGTMRVGESRVLEVDPLTQQIAWRYGEGPGEGFFSEANGFVQRLPNGNTLITISAEGRAIEITPDRRVVWEYDNPFRAGEKKELVATLHQVERVPPPEWAARTRP
jgi:hypothetical protein